MLESVLDRGFHTRFVNVTQLQRKIISVIFRATDVIENVLKNVQDRLNGIVNENGDPIEYL